MQGYEPLSSDRVSAETSMSDYNAGYGLLYLKDRRNNFIEFVCDSDYSRNRIEPSFL